jgi:hypothetical protein
LIDPQVDARVLEVLGKASRKVDIVMRVGDENLEIIGMNRFELERIVV